MAIRRAISAIMPTCSDEECLVRAVESLHAALAGCSEEFEIILLDGGSGKAPGLLTDALTAMMPEVRIIQPRSEAGLGASLREGFLAARLPLVLRTDLVNRVDPGEIPLLLARIDQADMVTGYRARRQDPWLRRLLSWGFGKMIGTGFGVYVRDCGCAFTLYRRKVFKHITMESRTAFLDVEILAKANVLGYRIDEVAVAQLPPGEGRIPERRSPAAAVLGDAWRLLHSFELTPDPSVRHEGGDSQAVRSG